MHCRLLIFASSLLCDRARILAGKWANDGERGARGLETCRHGQELDLAPTKNKITPTEPTLYNQISNGTEVRRRLTDPPPNT